jgi:small-conductance mechanosensitive channel/CRP-like cAMP-binding protein
LLALLALGWLLRQRTRIRLGAFYNIFCLITAFGVWLALEHKYGLLKGWELDSPLRWYAAVLVFFAGWYLARIFSTFFWDYYLFERRKMQVPGLLRNVVTVLILITTTLIIVRLDFGESLSGLLVTSSVMAAILAFALQDFLSGIIAGIALNIEPPFQVGDWVMVGDKEGEVVDVNWRATTLRALDTTYVIIPNSLISKDQIINFHKPTKLHALRKHVGVEYDAPPTRVKDILITCALETQGVVSTPRPISRLLEFGDFAITYELKFWIEDHSKYQDIQADVMARIWYNLRRNNIRIPLPIRDVFIHEGVDKKESLVEMNQRRVEGFLRRVSIFEPLDDAGIKTLAVSGHSWHFGKGERIVKQGDVGGNSLFLVLQGSAGVYIKTPDNCTEVTVGHLEAGDFFGERSLLTGEPRSASVIAETDIEVIEIEKANMLTILETEPGIMEELSRRLAERQLINEGFFKEQKKAEEVAVVRANYTARFLQNMRTFFGL